MLDLLGKEYIIDYCVQRWVKDKEEELYRIYVTDSIKNINESVSNFLGGKVYKERYYDLANKTNAKEPTETAEEIKERIIGKIAALEQ